MLNLKIEKKIRIHHQFMISFPKSNNNQFELNKKYNVKKVLGEFINFKVLKRE